MCSSPVMYPCAKCGASRSGLDATCAQCGWSPDSIEDVPVGGVGKPEAEPISDFKRSALLFVGFGLVVGALSWLMACSLFLSRLSGAAFVVLSAMFQLGAGACLISLGLSKAVNSEEFRERILIAGGIEGLAFLCIVIAFSQNM